MGRINTWVKCSIIILVIGVINAVILLIWVGDELLSLNKVLNSTLLPLSAVISATLSFYILNKIYNKLKKSNSISKDVGGVFITLLLFWVFNRIITFIGITSLGNNNFNQLLNYILVLPFYIIPLIGCSINITRSRINNLNTTTPPQKSS